MDPIKRNNVNVLGNLAAERTLLFVHGFGTDQHAWAAVVEPLLQDFRIVLLDNVGAGQSAPEAFVQHKYLGLTQYARDVVSVGQALRLQNTILVGHSVGGMVCLLAAVQAPEMFCGLAMLGASPRYLDDTGYRGGFCEADIAQIYDSISSSYAKWTEFTARMAMMNLDRPQLTRHFADSLKAIPSERALTVLCSALQSDCRRELGKVSLPTLIIQTASDYAVPLSVGEYLRDHILGSRLEVIDAEGHLPHISAPEKVLAVLQPFVRA